MIPVPTSDTLVALALFLTVAALVFALVHRGRVGKVFAKSILSFESDSTIPTFVTTQAGEVIGRNKAADELNPDEQERQTVQDLLSHLMADPNSLVFRIQERVNDREWTSIKLSTRANKVDVSAMCLADGNLLWRVIETKLAHGIASKSQDLTVSIGRNGAVLSVGPQLLKLLENKPKNLRDFIEWPIPKASGTCRLRTIEGSGAYYCVYRDVALGRSEMSFFEMPEEPQDHEDILDTLPIPLLQLDDRGKILATNAAAQSFAGNSNLLGRTFSELFEGVTGTVQNWIVELLEQNKDSISQFGRLSSLGNDKYVQVTLSRAIVGGQTRLLAVLSDATELKTLEAQFVQSQKMQAIGQLAGGVAHDFNNLLTAITGHCDLLLLRHGEADPDYADLDQIRQNANRAAALVSQLLAFSRKQTLQPEPLDLEQTLSDHTHLLNRLVGEETRLTLEHGENVKKINADKRQFEQVIMNLVVNARDAMGGKGRIRIATDMKSFAQPEKRDRATIPAGEYCSITVMDEGCGIDADKIQRIFEPFYTSKRTGEGTGLGLSTVYGIVKQSGGFIFVDSVMGVGSTFELLFPVSKVQMPARQEHKEIRANDKMTERGDGVVLLVEDEAPVRAFASRALKLRGFTVYEATCAEEALDMLADAEMKVDIFVTDVVMPGIDGPTWVGEALKTRPDTKVVFVSGYAENRCDELADNIPNSIFLPKPFSLNQLTSTVAGLH